MHHDAMPAKNMPTTSHLRALKPLLQTNRTDQLVFRIINYMLHFTPLLLSNSFKTPKTLQLLRTERCHIKHKSKSSHKAIFAVLIAISG